MEVALTGNGNTKRRGKSAGARLSGMRPDSQRPQFIKAERQRMLQIDPAFVPDPRQPGKRLRSGSNTTRPQARLLGRPDKQIRDSRDLPCSIRDDASDDPFSPPGRDEGDVGVFEERGEKDSRRERGRFIRRQIAPCLFPPGEFGRIVDAGPSNAGRRRLGRRQGGGSPEPHGLGVNWKRLQLRNVGTLRVASLTVIPNEHRIHRSHRFQEGWAARVESAPGRAAHRRLQRLPGHARALSNPGSLTGRPTGVVQNPGTGGRPSVRAWDRDGRPVLPDGREAVAFQNLSRRDRHMMLHEMAADGLVACVAGM